MIKIGLIKYRDDVNNYIKLRLIPKTPNINLNLDDNHPLNTVKYATGTCCRKCLKFKFNMNTEWDDITIELESKIMKNIMKWSVDNNDKFE